MGDSGYDLTPELIPIRLLIKTETTNEGDNDVPITVRAIPWCPTDLGKLQQKYSRHPEESEVEFLESLPHGGGPNPVKQRRSRRLLGP